MKNDFFLGDTLSPGNPNCSGRVTTVDLLVITTSIQLLSIQKNDIFTFFRTLYLHEEVNRTEPSSSARVPCSLLLTERGEGEREAAEGCKHRRTG